VNQGNQGGFRRLVSPEADFCSVYSGVAGIEYGAARALSEADSGLSMFGKAFEFRQLNKHLPGTAEAAKQLAVDGQAFVFNDLSTASRVESEIFARGIQTGSRGGVTRYGLYFDQSIGTQLFEDGGARALNYGQFEVKGERFVSRCSKRRARNPNEHF